MTRAALLAIIVALFAACYPQPQQWVLPVPPVEIKPQVLPQYKCDRHRSRWCELSPNWREV